MPVWLAAIHSVLQFSSVIAWSPMDHLQHSGVPVRLAAIQRSFHFSTITSRLSKDEAFS